jgi:hypothetical protein
LKKVVGGDAAGPQQQQQIRCFVHVGGQGGEFGVLLGDAPLDLGPHLAGRIAGARHERSDRHRLAFRMEDHAAGGAFDVDGPAILAAPAVIGHHRKRLLLALPGSFQVFQRLFHLQQVERHAPQRLAGLFRLVGGLFGARAQRPQQLFFGLEPAALVLHFAAQLGARVLFVVQAGGDLLELFADFSHLQLYLDLLTCQLIVQNLAFPLPGRACLLLKSFAFGLLGGCPARMFLSQPGGFTLCSGLGGLMGLPVHDQQDQNQRPHSAQQYGQEGECRDLQLVPASSHAAFPG